MDYQILKDSPLNNDYTSVYFANDHRDLFDRLDAAFAARESWSAGRTNASRSPSGRRCGSASAGTAATSTTSAAWR
ncbi:hypothetical protein ACFSTC_17920 [Nonomuraea ferruginea]